MSIDWRFWSIKISACRLVYRELIYKEVGMTELYNPNADFFKTNKLKSKQGSNNKSNDGIRFYSAIVSENNKEHILSVLTPLYSSLTNVLEINSGTGQHARFFAENLPHLTWRTSDSHEYLSGVRSWVMEAKLKNLIKPFELDTSVTKWPSLDIDSVFTANSLHMMSMLEVEKVFSGVGLTLKKWGSFVVYGPFVSEDSYQRTYQQLNRWLSNRGSSCGIKKLDDIEAIANKCEMQLVANYSMPENNYILHFVKI